MMWEPISIEALYDKILLAEEEMRGEILRFWELIQIFPEKWQQLPYGQEGDGFWAVGLCGKQVIWYNDIEEGFNISDYDQYGLIKDYWCNQDELQYPVQQLLSIIKMGGEGFRRAGPPQEIE